MDKILGIKKNIISTVTLSTATISIPLKQKEVMEQTKP